MTAAVENKRMKERQKTKKNPSLSGNKCKWYIRCMIQWEGVVKREDPISRGGREKGRKLFFGDSESV